MSSPFFSVIVPAYNQAQYLPETLESLLSQTFSDWEAVIVNDGSTDDTPSVMKEYAKKDSRFRLIHKENGGTASAFNEGLKHANGEWITWVSSDDLFEPDAFEIFREAIEDKPGFSFFHSHFYLLDEKTGRKTAPYPERHILMPSVTMQVLNFFLVNWIHGLGIVVNRRVFDKVGDFNPEYTHAHDADMWMRIAVYFPLSFINKRTCITRLHKSSLTSTFTEAGFFDTARLCVNFLNKNDFTKIFPLLNLSSPNDIQIAVYSTINVAVNPDAHMYRAVGYITPLIDRLCEWISQSCPEETMTALRQQIDNIVKDMQKSDLPHGIKAGFLRLKSAFATPFKYEPYDPISAMIQNVNILESGGKQKEADLIRKYLLRDPVLKSQKYLTNNIEVTYK